MTVMNPILASIQTGRLGSWAYAIMRRLATGVDHDNAIMKQVASSIRRTTTGIPSRIWDGGQIGVWLISQHANETGEHGPWESQPNSQHVDLLVEVMTSMLGLYIRYGRATSGNNPVPFGKAVNRLEQGSQLLTSLQYASTWEQTVSILRRIISRLAVKKIPIRWGSLVEDMMMLHVSDACAMQVKARWAADLLHANH